MRLEGKAQKRVPDRSGGVDRRGDTAEGIKREDRGWQNGDGMGRQQQADGRADREGGKGGEGKARVHP